MEITKKQRPLSQRRGLSFLEFVGCLVAMVGGVTLGSMYLGIDVKQMAIGVLVQAQVVEATYFGQATTNTAMSAATEPAPASAEVSLESSSAAIQPADLATTEAAPTTDQPAAPRQPTPQETRAATRAYWNTLTECMLVEAHGRLRGEGSPEEWQLYDYLLQREQGHEKALKDLEALDEFGVDERLVEHGEQVTAWHKSGVKLFDYALSLLSDGPGAKLTGPFAQSWQSAATQLRMEENLVIERHRAVANYLDREYRQEKPFVPAFQQQLTK
ncbi:MAG: hypothetical protein SH868_05900 [Bythopirellula sp.]|nr:hypothetical protein [Bythopirellula sp.]